MQEIPRSAQLLFVCRILVHFHKIVKFESVTNLQKLQFLNIVHKIQGFRIWKFNYSMFLTLINKKNQFFKIKSMLYVYIFGLSVSPSSVDLVVWDGNTGEQRGHEAVFTESELLI